MMRQWSRWGAGWLAVAGLYTFVASLYAMLGVGIYMVIRLAAR